jgi:hypothetical protein
MCAHKNTPENFTRLVLFQLLWCTNTNARRCGADNNPVGWRTSRSAMTQHVLHSAGNIIFRLGFRVWKSFGMSIMSITSCRFVQWLSDWALLSIVKQESTRAQIHILAPEILNAPDGPCTDYNFVRGILRAWLVPWQESGRLRHENNKTRRTHRITVEHIHSTCRELEHG